MNTPATSALNVLGQPLRACSYAPLTGFLRDGCCHTREDDTGSHVVCARMTAEFLAFTRSRGNDLSTPRPSGAFQACAPATAGACARCAGKKPSMPVWPRRWTCTAPTSGRWTLCPWPICRPAP